MGPSDLEEIIGDIRCERDPNVLVGPGDDAGVYLVGEHAIVETVDVITPVVNDPFTFGAISAVNSLSDVYAMGGIPRYALAVAGFPSCEYELSVFKEIIKGAVSALERAGAVLIGGHSFENDEIKFGLAVTGSVKRDRILRATGAEEGNVLVITKPIGIGILTTALKGGLLTDADIKPAADWMLTLNGAASALAVEAGAKACTDVTGFGILGHALNMAKGTDLDFVINHERIAVLDRVEEMIDAGMVPEGAYDNLRFMDGKAEFPAGLLEERKLLLCDPQTSGGLLIAVDENGLRAFEESALFFRVIGRAVKGTGKILVE